MIPHRRPWIFFMLLSACSVSRGSPQLLDDQFDLPPGFHICRAAGPELSGGSYALTFDGQGRLLVGDGNAVRRLIDQDGDGVFDSFEVIATGLGPRGPQGLLVYGDRLYAVGGDGVQVFEGYGSGAALIHRGRIGNQFNTGGDHDAHTIFRGHDGYLYLMAGNGAGIGDRKHITEEASPVLFEREASVFRISPEGQRWECLAAGGRNPPNLGMNYLGDLFSFDSDMEWHVGLPWYRPVRLNHWAIGGDQGWQEVGAYPPYYIDCLPGVLEVGRGSPTWGRFYEHNQFPERYRDCYFVCDYRWKRESNDQYATTGRLVVFFLTRMGAGWNATMEVCARPKPGARDAAGRLINFALVDVEVAPDGSLFLTDHNQGIWRIFYDWASARPRLPALRGGSPNSIEPARVNNPLDRLISLPQPMAEWSRLEEERIRNQIGATGDQQLQALALDSKEPLAKRLRAVRMVAPAFARLPDDFLASLAQDKCPEIRGQAAWLVSLRLRTDEVPLLLRLSKDKDPFVRRRAVEAFTRLPAWAALPEVIGRLGDSNRLVRSIATTALAHYPASQWLELTVTNQNPKIRMRGLVASLLRREAISNEAARNVIQSLLDDPALGGTTSTSPLIKSRRKTGRPATGWNLAQPLKEDRLDFLRLLALVQKQIDADPVLKQKVTGRLVADFPDADHDIRWEQIRLLGEYAVRQSFSKILVLLENERDEVTQFHIAQAIARIPAGWSSDEEERALRWMLATQRGWFAQFDGKGVEFPLYLSTMLGEFGKHHAAVLVRNLSKIDPASLLGGVMLDLVAGSSNAEGTLIGLYRHADKPEARVKIAGALKNVRGATVSAFLRDEYQRAREPRLRAAILHSLAGQPLEPANLPLIAEGLRHEDVDVVNLCAATVLQFKPALTENLAKVLLSRLVERRSLFYTMDNALAGLSGQRRPGFKPGPAPRERLDEATRGAAIDFWKNWYWNKFGNQFESILTVRQRERSDEELHHLILGADFKAGNSQRGANLYESLQCNNCHGGGVTPGREGRFFGPDLAGATRRLTRPELADSIVYPSKQVADRFRAYEVTLKDGGSFTGFITEQNNDSVTLVDREQLRRLARSSIRSIAPQSVSLMPERLLNGLSDQDISDLMAFLEDPGRPVVRDTGNK
jgi:putative heme-binding domain-containing protein